MHNPDKNLRNGTKYNDIFSTTVNSSHPCWNKWCYAEGSDIPGAPESGDVWYEVFTGGVSNRAFQLAIGCYQWQNSLYIRFKHDTTWSGWKRILTEDVSA